jgi:hypothetical protein
MSVPVEIGELPAAILAQTPWCYLLTVSDQGSPRAVAVAPVWSPDGRSLQLEVGRRTAANVATRPNVSLVWPPSTPAGMSLIVDGQAVADALQLSIQPTTAVMHRSAVSG